MIKSKYYVTMFIMYKLKLILKRLIWVICLLFFNNSLRPYSLNLHELNFTCRRYMAEILPSGVKRYLTQSNIHVLPVKKGNLPLKCYKLRNFFGIIFFINSKVSHDLFGVYTCKSSMYQTLTFTLINYYHFTRSFRESTCV